MLLSADPSEGCVCSSWASCVCPGAPGRRPAAQQPVVLIQRSKITKQRGRAVNGMRSSQHTCAQLLLKSTTVSHSVAGSVIQTSSASYRSSEAEAHLPLLPGDLCGFDFAATATGPT